MSKLDELIKELCPDGVEYKAIKDCVLKIRNIKWKNADESETYSYIDLTSVNRDKSGIDKTISINRKNAPSRAQQIVKKQDILLGTTRPMLKRFCIVPAIYDNQICSTGFCVLRANPEMVLPQYLYHHITSSKFFNYVEKNQKGASYPSISDDRVKAFRIPVPPMEVQREIVKILDNFTELTAELTARKKQYEYYRNRLLTFEHNCRKGKIIDMLARPITDGPHTTPEFTEKGIPFISAEAIWDGKIHFEKKRGYITEAFDVECCKKYKPQKNDVFMVKSGSTTGKVAYVDTNESFNVWSPLAAMRVNQENNPRFLFYLLKLRTRKTSRMP